MAAPLSRHQSIDPFIPFTQFKTTIAREMEMNISSHISHSDSFKKLQLAHNYHRAQDASLCKHYM